MAVIWLIEKKQNDPNGDEAYDGQGFEGNVVNQSISQHGMDGSDQFSRESSILNFVCKGVDHDVTCDLINDQKCHVVGHEIVGSESVHATFAVGNTGPHGEIDDGRDQPIEQVHNQVSTVLPLFRPVDLPESLENLKHKNSSLKNAGSPLPLNGVID
jgi:hypothetical protein